MSSPSKASRPRPPSRPTSASVARPSVVRPALLYAQPSSVHFGGFSLETPPSGGYVQRLCIYNNSAKPVRLQYTLPSQAHAVFQARFPHARQSFLSPGLCEELVIAFTPSVYQYYYDCIQIKCEQVAYASNTDTTLVGKLLVPLHAYPVVNTVAFPPRMDFGVVALGTTVRKTLDLSCSVPIEFEFELVITKPHAAFTIFPLQGTIPANGATILEFEFQPLLYATACAEVELRVSQVGFQPLKCVLSGSSTSTVAMDTTVATSPTTQRPRTADDRAQSKASPSRPTKSMAVTTSKDTKEMVQGVEIPSDFSSPAHVNFVLTQQPGKLKPKDLKKAIEANRTMRQQQKEEQAKLSNPIDSNQDDTVIVSPAVLSFHVLLRDEAAAIDRASVRRPMREMVFLQELSEIETIEKELEFQSHKIRLGQELLTPEQVQVLQEMRALNALELARREREQLRNDVMSRAFDRFSQPTPEIPYPPRGVLPAHFEPVITPDFKSYKNDLWDRRKRVVQRFVRAISTVMIRHRAQSRLEKLQKWLGEARTRDAVREKVAREWQQITQGAASSIAASTTRSIPPPSNARAHIYLKSFPIVDESDHKTRTPIPLATGDWDLHRDPFTFFPLRERDEALVAGHEPLDLPPLATYVPLEDTRELRRGALDECSSIPEDSTETPSFLPIQDLKLPSTLEMMPRDVFSRTSAAVRPLVRINRMRETLASFPLRPQRVFRTTPQHWGLALDTGLGTRSLRSLRTGLLRLSDRYEPRTERPRGPPPLLLCGASEDWISSDKDLYRDVWDASDGFVPPLSTSADDVPYLSDSESDDEEKDKRETTRQALPTWQDALQLWEETEDDQDDGVAYEPGELLGRAQGITCFERYRHLIQSEREYNAYRDEKLQQLPTLLTAVAAKIDHPDYQLVVEGHGPSRPLHTPLPK